MNNDAFTPLPQARVLSPKEHWRLDFYRCTVLRILSNSCCVEVREVGVEVKREGASQARARNDFARDFYKEEKALHLNIPLVLHVRFGYVSKLHACKSCIRPLAHACHQHLFIVVEHERFRRDSHEHGLHIMQKPSTS